MKPKRVIVPYLKRIAKDRSVPEYHETRKFCGNLPGPSGKAKYSKSPIVNKYREGKVKSTPIRGVK